MTQPIIYVVDDDGAVRDSLTELGQSMGLKVEGYETALEFLDGVDPNQPGCLILDIRMPGMSGLELQDQLKSQGIFLPVIFVTGHGDVPMSVQAIKKGAHNFLEKPFSPEQLVENIREAINLDASLRQMNRRQSQATGRLESLTGEERRIMICIAEGMTNNDIAAKLDISLRTVQFRRASIMKKIGAESKAEMVQVVRDAGLLAVNQQPAQPAVH